MTDGELISATAGATPTRMFPREICVEGFHEVIAMMFLSYCFGVSVGLGVSCSIGLAFAGFTW